MVSSERHTYGEGRASPRSFLTHHVANISTAIQAADAQTILNAASAHALTSKVLVCDILSAGQ